MRNHRDAAFPPYISGQLHDTGILTSVPSCISSHADDYAFPSSAIVLARLLPERPSPTLPLT